MNKLEYDFLIIGSGLAGLYSAHYASKFGRVALLTKSTLEISNSSWAQGGIAAAVGPDDNPALHFDDTIKAGRGLCDTDSVKILVVEGRERILELIEQGVPFDKENGELALGLEGGHSRRRVLHAAGDATGREIVNYFTKIVKGNNSISIFENTFVYNLAVNENGCNGACAYNYLKDENVLFTSSVTVLASGGASGLYNRTTNPHTSTGDGLALAWNAGAEIADMEFIQFHPTSFYSDSGKTFLVSEAVRGEGAYLINETGERFMLKVDPQAELAPRDVVASAIFNEMQASASNNVYLKLDHLNADRIIKRFSNINNEALKFGIDITKDKIPVAPAAHYTVGGVRSGLNGETNIPGLFVCGEAASTGVHGANRLASNSLLECVVFGRRAVDCSLKMTNKNNTTDLPGKDFYVNEKNEPIFREIKNRLAEVMTTKVGILRNEESIKNALNVIGGYSSGFKYEEAEYYNLKLKNLVIVCKLIAGSALLRKESRGAHKRTDFTKEDESMCFHIVQQKNSPPEFITIKTE